jgi:hypothetical protein
MISKSSGLREIHARLDGDLPIVRHGGCALTASRLTDRDRVPVVNIAFFDPRRDEML